MAYISQIVVDGVAYDVQAKALDSTLDATILKKTNLVNGFTQTTSEVNALDAAAGKTLNDTKANKSAPTLYFKIGTQDGDPQSSYPHVELRSSGNASGGRSFSAVYCAASDTQSTNYLIDKNGTFLPDYATKTELANKVENPQTNTISAGNSRTVTLDFSDRDTYLLFIGAGYYDSSASALHGIYIVRNGAVTGIMHASSMTISISGANLTIQHSGSSSTVRYVII